MIGIIFIFMFILSKINCLYFFLRDVILTETGWGSKFFPALKVTAYEIFGDKFQIHQIRGLNWNIQQNFTRLSFVQFLNTSFMNLIIARIFDSKKQYFIEYWQIFDDFFFKIGKILFVKIG